jgi:hypothetical protein
MKKLADIATAHAIGERGMGKFTGRRFSPTHDELARLAFSLYESRGRQEIVWHYA